MTLPNDVSRCVGRIGLGPDDPICQKRERCERWLTLQSEIRWGREDYRETPIITHCYVDGDATAFMPAEGL